MYLLEVKISEHQRAKYYEAKHGDVLTLPKKFLTKDGNLKEEYVIGVKNDKWIVYDPVTKTPIIANPTKVGLPRFARIKGQDMYSQNINEFTRSNIMSKIKDSFREAIQAIEPITEFPLRITMEVHNTIKLAHDKAKSGTGVAWDIDNHSYPYCKAFSDVLQEERKIPNDDRLHITEPPHGLFCPVDNVNDRKLIFIITKDAREIINGKKEYQKSEGISEGTSATENNEEDGRSGNGEEIGAID